LQKILPKDPTVISQITPEYLKSTIDNCINQVNDLKKSLGLETENEVEVTASSSYETLKPEKSILAKLEANQNTLLKLKGELKITFPKEETQEKASLLRVDASELLSGFLNQLKNNAELIQKLKPEIVKVIQDLQGEIAKQQIPLFDPEVLRAIEIVTRYRYKKEDQVNDISRHLKSQKEKTDDLKEILTRWAVIHETLENISSRLEKLFLLYGSSTGHSCDADTWKLTRKCIIDLYLERDLVTEPSMKNMISMSQFTNLWKRLKNFSVFLRASRKIESDNNKPNDQLADKYTTQKAQLIELNTQYNYIKPIIASIVEQLQKQVDVGASGEPLTPEALKRIAIVLNRTVDDIRDNNIKPFERDHEIRAALLSTLKSKITQINDSAELAKKEVNRTFDAMECGNVYRYETVYNLRGYSDPEVDATFKDGASSSVVYDSPLITRHVSDNKPPISSR
jgi:hypothetical protein